MTKPMDKREVLDGAFLNALTDIRRHYYLTEPQRSLLREAKIGISEWENMTPALPVVTMVVAGHRENIIAPELMGRNKAPIEALGKKIALKCYQWVVAPDPE